MVANISVKFTDEVYWALVKLKDQGNYRSVDAALRPLLGLPQLKNSQKKRFEVVENANNSDFARCSWYRPVEQITAEGDG